MSDLFERYAEPLRRACDAEVEIVAAMSDAGISGPALCGLVLLRLMDTDETTPSEAKAAASWSLNVAYALTLLERQKMLARLGRDPNDGRLRRIALTPLGRAKARALADRLSAPTEED